MQLLALALLACGPTLDRHRDTSVPSPTTSTPPVDTSDPSEEPAPAAMLVINEFMASNATTILDPLGRPSDWIELYNPGPSDAALDGLSLTDDLDDPFVFELADGLVVPAGGYLLLWATAEELPQFPLFVTFQLASDGEELGLFASDAQAIDTLVFGPQAVDLSAARFPDGGSDWVIVTEPTPGGPNPAPL